MKEKRYYLTPQAKKLAMLARKTDKKLIELNLSKIDDEKLNILKKYNELIDKLEKVYKNYIEIL